MNWTARRGRLRRAVAELVGTALLLVAVAVPFRKAQLIGALVAVIALRFLFPVTDDDLDLKEDVHRDIP